MRTPFASFLLAAALPLSVALLAPSQNTTAPGTQTNKVMLFQASPYEIKPGDTLLLQGSGFSKSSNNVYFGSSINISATSSNGTVLRVVVPQALPLGEYSLSVSNKLGSSSDSSTSSKVSIKVTSSPRTPPVILSVSFSGGEVTLTGEGFSSSNSLITNFGTLEGVVSLDGRSLNFQIKNLSDYTRIKKQLGDKSIQTSLLIYVSNDRGINKDPYKANITI